ncbi:uncharacterized protein N7515_009154 [Penicillium bovifimosum]|uniref:Uncharacterized protein n=1 Tax=Penicillium bovifimosum TaxID=126998 RepID=A0A9W9KVK1_9EURO|nr:uncharacterized protein N7515_009154 [Penicillium bovifimosum]KAJ5121193.1 hypothetical protein N7515_009154 [Penicillium bovifimosum]
MTMAGKASALDFEMSMRTLHLEREYEKTLSDSARLLDDERDRMRRVELMLLRFDNEALRSELEEAKGHLMGLTSTDSEACVQLKDACQDIDRLERQGQAYSAEIERLKEELSTRRNNSTSYNTLLAEKAHLSRENSTLQAELQRLKAQNTLHQSFIAEKHDVERQIISLEVQFDNERHAHERTQAKGSQQAAEIARLSARVEELQNQLAVEMRAKQQQQRDFQHQNSAWANQRATLEGNINSLKQHLRSTKDKLQEIQTEVQQRRGLKQHAGNQSDFESSSRAVPLQRPGPSGHANVTIATPGAVRMQEKLRKDSAMPGDKSAFSITPFLNRTGAPSDSPMSPSGDEDDILGDPDRSHELLGKRGIFGGPNRVGSALRRQLSPTEDRNPIPKAPKPRPGGRESATAISAPAKEAKKASNRLDRMMQPTETDELHEGSEHEQTKPKKRKLGGQRDRSLFEEEEEEELGNLKIKRKHAMVHGRGPTLGNRQQPSTSTSLGFGAPMGFSPLKKDRKRF